MCDNYEIIDCKAAVCIVVVVVLLFAVAELPVVFVANDATVEVS